MIMLRDVNDNELKLGISGLNVRLVELVEYWHVNLSKLG